MPTEFERAILAFEGERLGRFSRVLEHYYDDRTIRVPVAEAESSPEKGLSSYATIGLSQFDNDLIAESGRPLRVEFLATARTDQPFMSTGLANCAYRVASGSSRGRPGIVSLNVFADLDESVTTPHALLWLPFQWERPFSALTLDGLDIEWLLTIPVTQAEVDFIVQRGPGADGPGANALIDVFEAETPDIWDLTRPSVV